jgi:hypothetical protein
MNSEKLWWTSSCGRVELQIDFDDALACSHSGSCDSDIEWLRTCPYIIEQLSKLSPKLIADGLKECGAWDADELADHDANLSRLLWIACCDLRDQTENAGE